MGLECGGVLRGPVVADIMMEDVRYIYGGETVAP
jgi:hypothetical protein